MCICIIRKFAGGNIHELLLFSAIVCIGLASIKCIIHLNMFSFLMKNILQLQMNIVHLFVTRFM